MENFNLSTIMLKLLCPFVISYDILDAVYIWFMIWLAKVTCSHGAWIHHTWKISLAQVASLTPNLGLTFYLNDKVKYAHMEHGYIYIKDPAGKSSRLDRKSWVIFYPNVKLTFSHGAGIHHTLKIPSVKAATLTSNLGLFFVLILI